MQYLTQRWQTISFLDLIAARQAPIANRYSARWSWMICFVASCLLLSSDVSAQQPDSEKQAARELLGPLWEKPHVGSTKADEYVAALPAQEQQSLAVQHAYLLNRIHFSKFRDGLVVAEKLASSDADNPELWMSKAWLEVVLQNPDRALVSIQKLNALLIKPDLCDESQKRRFYSFMGRAVGFIAGPAGKEAHPDTLQDTVAQIEQGLIDPWRGVFQDNRQLLGDQVRSMLDDSQQVEQDFQQQAEVARDQEMQNLQSASQSIDARRQQLQPELDRVQDEARQRLQELHSQIVPLEQQANAINRSAMNAQIDLQVIYQDIQIQQGLLARERDPLLRILYANRIDQMFMSARNVEANLALLRNEYNAAHGQYLALEDQRNRLRQDYNLQLEKMRQELNQLDKDQRRNLARLDKLIRGPLPTSTRARALDDKAQVFWVHYPFPAESRRQALLDELK